jgi:hypothetical protein
MFCLECWDEDHFEWVEVDYSKEQEMQEQLKELERLNPLKSFRIIKSF